MEITLQSLRPPRQLWSAAVLCRFGLGCLSRGGRKSARGLEDWRTPKAPPLRASFGVRQSSAAFDSDVSRVEKAKAPDASNLPDMLSMLHVKTAGWINKLDGAPARQVWYNFRETRLTYQKSYLARLNYVHQNAVRHKLVPVANQYPWCSAAWFERTAP